MSTVSSNSTIDYTVAPTPVVEDRDPVYAGLRLSAWLQIGAIGGLFILLFWPNLRRLWYKTNPINGEPNWGHAVVVPFIGMYYLYINREPLLAARTKTAWEGLAITLGGILFFAYGIYPGRNDWFCDIGMVTTLFGVVTLLCGWRVMKIAWFPIVFLVCALPWPGLFYSLVAGPLQKMAAQVAVHILSFTGVPSGQFGTKIFIVARDGGVRTLNVAEACAGLRGLMTFVSIAAAVAFLSARPMWQKIILVASAIPIAIFCNTMRVTGQGFLARYFGPEWGENFAHGFVGLLMMIPAFFLILLVGWVLEHIFIEEVEDKSGLKRPKPPGVATATLAPAVAAPAAGAARTVAGIRPDVLGASMTNRAAALTPGRSPAVRPAGAPAGPATPRPAAKSSAAPGAGAKPAGTPPVRPAAVPPVGSATRRPPTVRPSAAPGAAAPQSNGAAAAGRVPPTQPIRRVVGLPPTTKSAAPRPAGAKPPAPAAPAPDRAVDAPPGGPAPTAAGAAPKEEMP
ncbi:MAG TPA: exosortase/archaeosortase family protein [Tepidisphaeraceae bacterium]|nr:exosortase/archaeosortase family protein [Tepidisphaeraceae bacterium]